MELVLLHMAYSISLCEIQRTMQKRMRNQFEYLVNGDKSHKISIIRWDTDLANHSIRRIRINKTHKLHITDPNPIF